MPALFSLKNQTYSDSNPESSRTQNKKAAHECKNNAANSRICQMPCYNSEHRNPLRHVDPLNSRFHNLPLYLLYFFNKKSFCCRKTSDAQKLSNSLLEHTVKHISAGRIRIGIKCILCVKTARLCRIRLGIHIDERSLGLHIVCKRCNSVHQRLNG